MTDTYQRRNLGSGEAWGREIEIRTDAADRNRLQIKQNLNNSNRAFSGQLAVLTNQVTELTARSIVSQSMLDYTVTGDTTAEPFPSASRSLVIPGTGEARSALVSVNAGFSDSVASGSSLYVEILVDGKATVRTNTTLFGRPAGWDDGSISVMFPVVISPTGSTLTMTLIRVGFTSTTSTWTAGRINVSTYYGDKV